MVSGIPVSKHVYVHKNCLSETNNSSKDIEDCLCEIPANEYGCVTINIYSNNNLCDVLKYFT